MNNTTPNETDDNQARSLRGILGRHLCLSDRWIWVKLQGGPACPGVVTAQPPPIGCCQPMETKPRALSGSAAQASSIKWAVGGRGSGLASVDTTQTHCLGQSPSPLVGTQWSCFGRHRPSMMKPHFASRDGCFVHALMTKAVREI